MDLSSIAGLSSVLLAATGASIAAIASFIVTRVKHKSEVQINIKSASGARISIEGSNISSAQVKEIMKILEEANKQASPDTSTQTKSGDTEQGSGGVT